MINENFFRMVQHGDIDAVRALLEESPRLDETHQQRTVLAEAANRGWTEIAQLLLDAGADPNGATGVAPLWEAAIGAGTGSADTLKVAALLLERNAHVDPEREPGRGTALYQVVGRHYSLPMAELLLEHGADPNARGVAGSTPIMTAAEYQRPEAIQLLLRNGADVNARTDDGRNAISFLPPDAKAFKPEAWELLLGAGCDVASTTTTGQPLIHKVLQSGPVAVSMVLDHGAGIEATDSIGRTPLFLAATAIADPDVQYVVVELLLERGARTDVRDSRGEDVYTAARRARAGLDVLRLLREHRTEPE